MIFDKEDADIIVLAYQPGIGKTHNAIEYMKKKENINTELADSLIGNNNSIVLLYDSGSVFGGIWAGSSVYKDYRRLMILNNTGFLSTYETGTDFQLISGRGNWIKGSFNSSVYPRLTISPIKLL